MSAFTPGDTTVITERPDPEPRMSRARGGARTCSYASSRGERRQNLQTPAPGMSESATETYETYEAYGTNETDETLKWKCH